MLDPKYWRENPEKIAQALSRRGFDTSHLQEILALDEKWRQKLQALDAAKSQKKQQSKQKPTTEEIERIRAESAQLKELEQKVRGLQDDLLSRQLEIPNIPLDSIPDGQSEKDNKVIRSWGEPKEFDFEPQSHDEIGQKRGILDFERAAKLSGARFVVYKGAGARLERALIQLMLDTHTQEHGYEEIWPPLLVNSASLTGTGQLPKFAADSFVCKDGDYWLVPTAEVPLTNLHRDEIFGSEDLPKRYTAYTPCFRREAGSYGRDTKGIIRQHQFNKVELVSFVRPEDSLEELEKLTGHAEKILQLLGLPYRVVELCAGDIGFAAAKTYDLEVWFPAQGQFREISSCSIFTDFQARRAKIRYRRDAEGKPELVHTLNGSGVAVGRAFAAILENYQDKSGRVELPEVLKPYFIGSDGFL